MAQRTCFTPRAFIWFIDKNIKRRAIEACRPDDPWAMSCKTNRKKNPRAICLRNKTSDHTEPHIFASRHDGFVISLWSFLSWPAWGIWWLIDASPHRLGHVQRITESLRWDCNTLTWYKLRSVRSNIRLTCSCLHLFKLKQCNCCENISDSTITRIYPQKQSINLFLYSLMSVSVCSEGNNTYTTVQIFLARCL